MRASLVFLGTLLLLGVIAPSGVTQSTPPSTGSAPVGDLGVASAAPGTLPTGWFGRPGNTIATDETITRRESCSIRLTRTASSEGGFSFLAKQVPIAFAGQDLEVRGYLRTEDVSNFAGIWVDEQKDGSSVAFENMQHQQVKGTRDWTEYSVKLPLRDGAQSLSIGVLLFGTGTLWASGLQLLIDGKPVAQAPARFITKQETVLDRDHTFDNGSGINLSILTPLQVDNLVTLGKVWGFLKYHHPAITSGTRHWDYELLRVLPKVLAAPDRKTSDLLMADWVASLGEVKACQPCVESDVKPRRHPSPQNNAITLVPDTAWLNDTKLLCESLSQKLLWIGKNRSPQQFYVSLIPNVRNPEFEHELWYGALKLPDAGFQLLAAYRFWNIIEYWAPYRDQVRGDWDDVLRKHLPQVMLAKDRATYQRALLALIAEAQDTHANLWNGLDARPPLGECRLPVNIRFVRGQAVVASLIPVVKDNPLQIGDTVTAIGGMTLKSLLENWSPYYAASNEATRLRDIGREMTGGPCGPVGVVISRDGKKLPLKTERLPFKSLSSGIALTHDLPGPTFQRLSDKVAYLKLSSVKVADVDKYLEAAKGSAGWIIDLRNYPSEFMVFALAPHFINTPTAFARFTNGDLSTPGQFHWTEPEMIEPKEPFYSGKVVLLVDEVSQSQAEYTAMSLRAGLGAVVVGSTTAGADGNVSDFPLPGAQSSAISGIGVFYPDGRLTQRVGIVPDKLVLPTLNGIRRGRDEVLEQAIGIIEGPNLPPAQIEKIIHDHPSQ